ncbi:serine/threonine-protein kinase pdik1l-A-like [Oculina patagonica]
MAMLNVAGKQLTIEQSLGKGGFGVVYRVRDVGSAELLALKDIPCQNPAAIYGALEEIKTLNSLDHPNIIKLMAADQLIDMQGIHVRILMEYCSGGNLNDRLARPSNDAMNLKWMRQIADALAYLHSRNVVHRDLKPDNVLLTDPVIEDVKLADFGLARSYISLQLAGPVTDAQYSSYMQTKAGTLPYMAPEVFAGHYTEKSDMFSLGVLFFAIVERGCIPLPNGKRIYGAFVPTPTGMVGLGYAMANGYPNSMVAFTRASPNVRQLIYNLLSSDYHQRMNARDVRV